MLEKNIISIQNFTGPLDLLYSLVQNKKIPLHAINLVELTNEYVKIVQQLTSDYDIEILSEYLVLASSLIHLKTKLLLKNPQEKKMAHKSAKLLLSKLFLYRQFKKISIILKDKALIRQKMIHKPVSAYQPFIAQPNITQLDGKGQPIHLIIALRKMFERINVNKWQETEIAKLHLSPQERREELLKILQQNHPSFFEHFFRVPTIHHFALTWITVLDMALKQEIILEQTQPFGKIFIKKNPKTHISQGDSLYEKTK